METEKRRKPLYVRVFHWVIVMLFVIAFATAYWAFNFDISMPIKVRDTLFAVHRLSGMVAGLLLLIWFLLALKNRMSFLRGSPWTKSLHMFHLILGIACFLLPLLPWIARAQKDRYYELYAIWPQYNLMSPPTTNFVYKLLALHKEMAAIVGAFLILHILGALFHAFFLKDKTLWRMWFGRK